MQHYYLGQIKRCLFRSMQGNELQLLHFTMLNYHEFG